MPQPNVLIFFAEQHRGDCLSSAGHPVLLTPNMDHIGGEGTRFTSAYTTCPVCVPARRSLLSGQYPFAHGARTNVVTEWDIHHTLPREMKENGYQTAWIGRSMHQHPPQKKFGWEKMTWRNSREDNEYHAFLERNLPEGGAYYHGSGVMHNDWTARSFHLPEHLHHTNWTIHEAQKFLDNRDTTRPFCMVVSFLAAHPPLIPPAFYMDRYLRTGVPNPVIGDWAEPPENGGIGRGVSATKVDLKGEALLSCRAGYYGLINHLDDQIRRLMNGVLFGVDLHNTVIIYAADHGEMLGDHYLWRKSVPYEGACHIPMLMRTPPSFGFTKAQVLDHPVSLEDIMPTVLELTGTPIPDTVEGKSLVPLLKGATRTDWRDFVHVECAPQHHTLTDGKEKFIWFVRDGREQFFRLTDDPLECHELIDEPDEADRIAMWRRRMIETLEDRPEGFSDGEKLIPGREYPADGRHLRKEREGERNG
ncbi:MAG: sulfatase-like hydrolase/transferase [Candidatus Brocadiia bacterium]